MYDCYRCAGRECAYAGSGGCNFYRKWSAKINPDLHQWQGHVVVTSCTPIFLNVDTYEAENYAYPGDILQVEKDITFSDDYRMFRLIGGGAIQVDNVAPRRPPRGSPDPRRRKVHLAVEARTPIFAALNSYDVKSYVNPGDILHAEGKWTVYGGRRMYRLVGGGAVLADDVHQTLCVHKTTDDVLLEVAEHENVFESPFSMKRIARVKPGDVIMSSGANVLVDGREMVILEDGGAVHRGSCVPCSRLIQDVSFKHMENLAIINEDLHAQFRAALRARGPDHRAAPATAARPTTDDNNYFDNVCLQRTLRFLGARSIRYTASGPFWILADGNEMIRKVVGC